MLADRDIICVGFNDWDNEVWTNQHHLMSRLAARNRVLFVESLGLRRPTVSGRDARRVLRRLRRGLAGPRTVDAGVHVVSPLVLPFHAARGARAVNAQLLPALVRRAARASGLGPRPILWTYVPQAEALVDALDPALVVYHCVDDIAAQNGVDGPSFAAAERRLLARTDLVLASAPPIVARLRTLGADPVYAPNVADVELFSGALSPGPTDPALAALPAPRIVFVGAVAAIKLDVALVAGVARARPSWSICLVGPVGLGDPTGDLSPLLAEPNVHLLGPRAQAELPAVMRGAAAGIIPYRRSPLTDSIFPMKVFEYLAAGVGVVATSLPSLAGEPGIDTADDVAGFVAALDRLLADTGDGARDVRSQLAAGRSWDARLDEIAAAIAHVEARPARPARGRVEHLRG